MRLVLALLALAAACTPDAPGAPADGGVDTAAPVLDLGPRDTGVDLGTDAGVDLGPACECSSVGPCCDGCHPLPAWTECHIVAQPDRCWPDTYVVPGWRGHVETRTYCGTTGACDGVTETVDVKWSCGSTSYCMVRTSIDGQAVCVRN
jgi:hypothetical protein